MQLRLQKITTLFGLNARHELRLALPFLVGLVALRALVYYLVWRNGFLEYDADGFTRSLHAWEWGQQPRLEVDAWLPLQFWLNGSLLHFWPDLFRAPRAVNLIASLVTLLNFFFIGRYLFGRLAGYATALLAAFFPWEIWFGLSGMSESLTQMFLSFGLLFFCRWLHTERPRDLWLASAGLLGATMLRYEAWFYSLTYAAIVLFLVYRRDLAGRPPREWGVKLWRAKILPPLTLAFGFALLWVIASTVQLGSPIEFIRLSSKINASLEETNANISLLGRLFFYPRIFFNLLPPLTVLAIAGSFLLLWRPAGRARIYLALIWGEFAFFVISTLPTNNIAPGSARYPVSNLMFLLPVVVYLFQVLSVWRPLFRFRNGPPGGSDGQGTPLPSLTNKQAFVSGQTLVTIRYSLPATLLFLLLPLLCIQTSFARSNDFPDNNMRQVALWFKGQTAQGKLAPNLVIPVHFPNPLSPTGADYTAIYGLSVLTNRPDGGRIAGSEAKGLRVISDIEGFEKTIIDDKPAVWLNLASAGDPERIEKLAGRYRERTSFGPYTIFSQPLNLPLSVAPSEGTLTQHYQFTGEGFDPGERVFIWVSYDASGAKSLEGTFADTTGRVKLDYLPGPQVPGTFSITAKGEKSQRRAVAEVIIR